LAVTYNTTDPGPKLTEAMIKINDKLFKNVILHNDKVMQINTVQFYRSLAYKIEWWLLVYHGIL